MRVRRGSVLGVCTLPGCVCVPLWLFVRCGRGMGGVGGVLSPVAVGAAVARRCACKRAVRLQSLR